MKEIQVGDTYKNCKDEIKKCIISRYDESIEKPPFVTIPIDKVEVVKPENDEGGVEFSIRLKAACRSKGYIFRFYTTCSNREADYEIVVFNEIMTKEEFKNKYLKNAFFWINEENHIKIQEVMQEFGVRCVTGSGFIKWHEGFKNLCTFPSNGFTGHEFYQKVDMWIPNARYGEPKNIERFFADYKALT